MMSQELKAEGRKYQVLPNFEICCWDLGGLKVKNFHKCTAVPAVILTGLYDANPLIKIALVRALV